MPRRAWWYFAPKGQRHNSPGHRPGKTNEGRFLSPEGATQKCNGHLVMPFQGVGIVFPSEPRALPWADLFWPLRGECPVTKYRPPLSARGPLLRPRRAWWRQPHGGSVPNRTGWAHAGIGQKDRGQEDGLQNHGCPGERGDFRPEGAATYQPRAAPWGRGRKVVF